MVAILLATFESPEPTVKTQIKPKRAAMAVACGAVLTFNFLQILRRQRLTVTG
ncbi:MAG: hypothetical protein KEFWMYNX_000801 [Candidatus Fervidibacter sp.]|jgi:hypothetical protein